MLAAVAYGNFPVAVAYGIFPVAVVYRIFQVAVAVAILWTRATSDFWLRFRNDLFRDFCPLPGFSPCHLINFEKIDPISCLIVYIYF